jgi:molybdate transport system permease protein
MNRLSHRARATKAPPTVIGFALVTVAFFALPFIALLWKAPWSDVPHILSKPEVRTALWLSLRTSLAATFLATLFGVPLAWVLAKGNFPGRRIVRALATISMVLPPVVGGITLLNAFGRRGLVGHLFDDWFGFQLTFTIWGVIVAQTFVAMPFLVLAVESAIQQVDPRHEGAAQTLGANPWYVFRRITLPAARSGVTAGMVLAWARAFGEFGATITFAGNFPGKTQTISIATYLALDVDPRDSSALSILMIVVSFTVLIGLRDRWLGRTEQGLPL